VIPSLKIDFDGNIVKYVSFILINKFLLVVQACFALAFLSSINALLIRVAILCSSVVIFPLLHCSR
jgi:hypothetical protein